MPPLGWAFLIGETKIKGYLAVSVLEKVGVRGQPKGKATKRLCFCWKRYPPFGLVQGNHNESYRFGSPLTHQRGKRHAAKGFADVMRAAKVLLVKVCVSVLGELAV